MYKLTLASIALLATLASAQLQGLPACSQSCVGTSFGGCGTLDVKCICSNKSLIDGLACCVSTACDTADQQTTINFANSLCQGYGITDLPQSATCAAGASSTTAAANSSSGTASAESTSRVTPVPQGSTTTTSAGAVSSASNATSSASESVSSAISSAASTASSAASASGAAASASSSAAGAAATKVGSAGLGLVVAGVLAVL